MAFQINKDDKKNLVIYDWKRVKKIKFENKHSSGYEPIEHIQNSN